MSRYPTDFGMKAEFVVPASGCVEQQFKRPPMDDFKELIRQNGEVVTQSLTQRCQPTSPCKFDYYPLTESINEQHQSLYIQEDDMDASCPWLHYPLPSTDFDDNEQFCSDFLYPPPSNTTTTPIHGISSLQTLPILENTTYPRDSSSVVDSNASSSAVRAITFSDHKRCPVSETTEITEIPAAPNSNGPETYDLTITSSNEGSTFSDPLPVSPPQNTSQATINIRKRKSTRRINNSESIRVEETEAQHGKAKKMGQKSTAKKPRAAEVHNLSERRRRDRINEKMRALQELIPRCNKSDKASMLDEAIEYLKSLQLQVQMMSMGCGMMPMMLPTMHQYVGMGFGMDMGVVRPMAPFANMNPRFPLPAFHGGAYDSPQERAAVPNPFHGYLGGHQWVQNSALAGGANASAGGSFENCEMRQ